MKTAKFEIELQAISRGYDRKTCWVHARAGAIPGQPPIVVVTMQKLRLTGDDVFYELHDMRTDDGGVTWSGPTPHRETLGRRIKEGGTEEVLCDFTPQWHAKSGVLLGTGHSALYRDDENQPLPQPRSTAYSAYDAANRSWAPWKKLGLPNDPKFFSEGAGSTQRFDLPNGEILLPTYFGLKETVRDDFYIQDVSTIMRCSFDGRTLKYLEHGTELTVPQGRGLSEPSITQCGDRYFLTLRNDDAGYVCSGTDGLHYDEPRPWTFDDGSDLGNYNTQQHWVSHRDNLFLVYTRRGANNDHIMRHRAPLFIAQVDQQRLCVLRKTERILVPERGARLCNFGVAQIGPDEIWITVAEWMQTKLPDWSNSLICEKYGSDNSIFIAKLHFN